MLFSVTVPFSYRLSGDVVLLSCDSGELEVWRCTEPGCMLELHSTLGSHDDMALSVGALADGGRVISAGADRRCVCVRVCCGWLDHTECAIVSSAE